MTAFDLKMIFHGKLFFHDEIRVSTLETVLCRIKTLDLFLLRYPETHSLLDD